jgi:RNA polymerase sigma-70 factor, ECF subfamily
MDARIAPARCASCVERLRFGLVPARSSDVSLAGIFRRASAGDDELGDAELGAALRQRFEEADRAWPGLGVSPDDFVRHLASRGAPGVPLAALHVTDLYLACACAARARTALDAFDRAYLGPLATLLARPQLAPEVVDELRQVLREKLFVDGPRGPSKIAEYDGRGALVSWVRVIARRAAIDLQRQRRAASEGAAAKAEARAAGDATAAEPEGSYLKRRYLLAFNDAIRSAVSGLSADQREILRLHLVEGHTLDRLAVTLGVHRATVARRLAAARLAIKDEARRRLRAELGVSEAELDSLTGLMRSQLELSLPGLLKSE